MTDQRLCDFCGRPGSIFREENSNVKPLLQVDEDGLWICGLCQKQLKSKPTALEFDDILDDELKPLVGKSAGAICRTLELPFVDPYKTIIEAASIIAYDQDRYMSAWLFVSLWLDGTTVWRAPESHEISFVSPAGTVNIQTIK